MHQATPGTASNPQPNGVILGAGAQILCPSFLPEFLQKPGNSYAGREVSISAQSRPNKPDKVGKDTNFRGSRFSTTSSTTPRAAAVTAVNTVYFIDTTGTACPGTGVGVPQPRRDAFPPAESTYNDPTCCKPRA